MRLAHYIYTILYDTTFCGCPSIKARRLASQIWSGLLLGIGLALALWGVFWVGDKVATWMFPFARPQVDTIYGMKESQSEWVIGLLLLFALIVSHAVWDTLVFVVWPI